jgi:phosphomannomutase/phosphoglucomutase
VVVLGFYAQTTAALERIQADFRRELSKLAPQAKLPF